jgi:hypothetical protein
VLSPDECSQEAYWAREIDLSCFILAERAVCDQTAVSGVVEKRKGYEMRRWMSGVIKKLPYGTPFSKDEANLFFQRCSDR